MKKNVTKIVVFQSCPRDQKKISLIVKEHQGNPNNPFIFSRRFSSEKSPTITVASFFFVRLFTHRVCTTFCELFTFTKSTQYLILNASKGLYLEMQNSEGSPFQFFGAMRLSPPLFRLCETFFEIF